VVRYLLEHDKHVLVEKPAASTPGEVAWLVKLAQSRGLKLGVGHIERCNPAVAKAEQLIAAGAIGRPLFGTSTRAGAFPANVAEGNDVILDLGIHEMDVLNRLFGPLKVVGGRGRDVQITGITDIADAWVEGRDGFFAAIHVDWHTPARIRTLRIVGERGILDLDYRQQTVSIDGGPPVELDKLEPLRLQLDRFYHFLMQSASDLCSGDEMTLSAQLLQDWSKLAGGA
jgi:UDP-N-acetylglucosamine 3-dehydrogenase